MLSRGLSRTLAQAATVSHTRLRQARSSASEWRALSSSSSATSGERLMNEDIPKSDHGAYKEYSVIHTDRSLNLMSDPFQRVMRDLNQLLKHTYNADKVIIIPVYVVTGC